MLIAWLYPADVPGLTNVVLSDGRTLMDLTMGQVRMLAAREGWTIRQ